MLFLEKPLKRQMFEKSSKIAAWAGWISVIANILLFGLKYWAGVVSGSVAMIADAWHTLSDSFTSVVVVVSLWFSRKPADKGHPFGHGRAELLAAVIIGILLAIVSFEFLIKSLERLRERQAAEYGTIAIIVTIVSILCKEGMAQYARIAGKLAGSKALIADAWHHRSDALSSLLILTGIFIGRHIWWIDGVLGFLVALFIFYAAFQIIRDSFNSLLGEDPEPEVLEQLLEICRVTSDTELFPHHIHVHNYGRHSEMTFHIVLTRETTLEQAHDIATQLENAIRESMGVEATIHMEPLKEIPDKDTDGDPH